MCVLLNIMYVVAIFPAVHGKKGTGKRGTNEKLVETAQKEKKCF